MCWSELPDVLLEEVYSKLTYKQRYYCSMVCRHWYDLFYSSKVWEHFVLGERTLTRRRMRPYRNSYMYTLSQYKAKMCLDRVGEFFKKITIKPISDYYNLYAFMTVLSAFLEFYEEYPMPLLHGFHFNFGCENRGFSGITVHGTGGKILEELKRLLGNMKNLEELTLNQLLLDKKEAPGLLESVLENCAETLKVLEIVNCTKGSYPMFYAGMFMSLQKLIISPQHLSSDVIAMLASTSLTDIHIVQDRHTDGVAPINSQTWFEVKQMSPRLQVRLEARGGTREEILFQPRAPVTSIVYDSPYLKMTPDAVMMITDHYRKTLRLYAQKGLPRTHGSRSFHERCDGLVLMLVRQCPELRVLIIRERISSMTLLLVASQAKKLQKLYVRQNAVLKKTDWPKTLEWSDEHYADLKKKSQSYELLQKEISRCMGYPWKLLTDKEFEKLKI
ncbi:uncharacterized protein LOC106171183 [Lingula anatina]|uniref:Uncharacterized protein LOC106171183 n=1 Tax=Lingula anatina TaxID=7574 RepID=A0A1S3JAD5_LINAN|nr:uncharacterized protein LOC106171183 [Lingula anatina]XP_013406845.1 uncharacterized protein LOC106171183 [Lingula anatina]|eukprot:XP_013406844.1 uncharacterized protein LOC106171183 [Lingula anatina]